MARPTIYDPAFIDRVIELGALGKSKEQICAGIGISRSTMEVWSRDNPEFLQACLDSHDLAQTWWEDQAQAYMLEHKDGPKLNAAIWGRSMAARFPRTYRESTKTEITGENGAPLITAVTINLVKPIDNSKD